MKALKNGLTRTVLWLWLLIVIFPLCWIILTAFKPSQLSQVLPPVWSFTPTLENFANVLTGNTYTSQVFGELIVHSVIVAVASTLLGLIAAVPAAYALARIPFVGKRGTANWILSTIMFPPMVAVIPVFLIASRLGVTDTWPVLVVPYAAFNLPMMIWMLRSSVKQIPTEIEEAAFVDGASRLMVLRMIVLPLLAPGMVSAALLAGTMAWNEFLFALTLTRSTVKTAPVGISEFTNMYGTQWGTLSAAATVTTVPILVITVLLRRQVIKGLTFGAVK